MNNEFDNQNIANENTNTITNPVVEEIPNKPKVIVLDEDPIQIELPDEDIENEVIETPVQTVQESTPIEQPLPTEQTGNIQF